MPYLSDVRLEYSLWGRVKGDRDHVEGRCALALDGNPASSCAFRITQS